MDTFFCPLTFCPVIENPDVQQMLESASPIGHYWTAYAETNGGLCGAQNETASAIYVRTMKVVKRLQYRYYKVLKRSLYVKTRKF